MSEWGNWDLSLVPSDCALIHRCGNWLVVPAKEAARIHTAPPPSSGACQPGLLNDYVEYKRLPVKPQVKELFVAIA